MLPLVAAAIAGSVITGGFSLIGSGISWWANSAAQDRQDKENRRVEAIQTKEYQEGIARSEKWSRVEQANWNKQFGAQEDQREINNQRAVRDSFFQMMSGNTQLANNMISIWRGRRAA